MRIENWVFQLFCGFLILCLGIWLEKRRDKKTKKWYHGGYLDFQFTIIIWSIILVGQIVFWQGILILLEINWIPVIGAYVICTGTYYLFQSLCTHNESSWYNTVIRHKGFAVGLILIGIFLIIEGW